MELHAPCTNTRNAVKDHQEIDHPKYLIQQQQQQNFQKPIIQFIAVGANEWLPDERQFGIFNSHRKSQGPELRWRQYLMNNRLSLPRLTRCRSNYKTLIRDGLLNSSGRHLVTLPSMTLPNTTNSGTLGKKRVKSKPPNQRPNGKHSQKVQPSRKTTFSTLSVIARARVWGMGRPGILWNLCFFPLVYARNIKANPGGWP